MKTTEKWAAQFHSQSEAPQAPTGNQEESQEEVSSPQCASDPGRAILRKLLDADVPRCTRHILPTPHSSLYNSQDVSCEVITSVLI